MSPVVPPLPQRLAANLARARERIATACGRSGRDPSEVTLVAVTKSAGDDEAAALLSLGVHDAGENRVDALESRRASLAALGLRPRWHMIGRLQTNKVRRALAVCDVLHSIDRTSLLEAVAIELARGARRTLPAFVQVNVSGEATKAGFAPDELPGALDRASRVEGLEVRGLMTMAPLARDAEASRPFFRRLRELRDEARARGYLVGLELSMGMSQDLDVAVEEGATHVRVGTILFEDSGARTCRT